MGVSYSPKIVTDGLVLCLDAANPKSYPGTGTNIDDIAGLGGSATINGTVSYSSGIFTFDGADDYIRYLRDDINAGSFAYVSASFEVWFKQPDTAPVGAASHNILTIENTFEISIGNNGNGTSSIQYASNPWAWIDTIDVTNDSWHQLVYTHTDPGRVVYIDGIEAWSVNTAGGLAAGTASYPYLSLGGRYFGTVSPFVGDISSVKIYSRVLTAEEIKQNFNATRGRFGI